MRYLLISARHSLAWLLVGSAAAQQSIYINNAPVLVPPDIAPTINATRVVNRSVFSINSSFIGLPVGLGSIIGFNPLPFETLNTRFFTNTGSGIIAGSPGFRYDYFHGNTRERMENWVNQGSVSAATWLIVLSKNLSSSGPLNVGEAGLMRLNATNSVRLNRVGLRAGATPGIPPADGFIFGTNYVNSPGVVDLYWGAGTNNSLGTMGQPMVIDGTDFNGPFFTLPNAQSAVHQVIDTSFGFRFTNNVVVPSFLFRFFGTNFVSNFPLYDAFVYTNRFSPTSTIVQVVFVPTNHLDTNFSIDVRFQQRFIGGAPVAVQFKAVDFDIVQQTSVTNTVYLVDTAATTTNVSLLRPLLGTTRRPSNFEVRRNDPFAFFGFSTTNRNAAYSPALLYNANYQSNAVPVLYAGYAAQISGSSSAPVAAGGTFEPRTLPGRVEILGGRANLDQTRIRAESTIIIKATDLINNKLPTVDAPFCIYDLTSLQPTPLFITNLAPAAVRRLSGQIAAWSAVWDNAEIIGATTNYIRFHVLIVDNNLQSLQPVLVNEFAAKATNLVIQDSLSIGRRMRLDARSLTVSGGLSLPFGSSWARTNVLNVSKFTNTGVINIPRDGFFGGDRQVPYACYVNSGTNIAAAHFIRATTFDNSGCIISSGGLLTLEARDASLQGSQMVITNLVFTNVFLDFSTGFIATNVATNTVTNVFGSKLLAAGDVRISANNLTLSNSFIASGALGSPGTLELTVTNSLIDSGLPATNRWFTSGGFECTRLPNNSDLFGTHVTSLAPLFNQEVFHVWCGNDVGPVNEGFNNNMALGKLTLDGTNLTLFHFSAPLATKNRGGSGALYVDYIEFQNYALNYESALDIDPSLTIYFAAANVAAEKLNGAAGGRIQWVSTFAGPLSSTNIFYPSTGQTYSFNIALVTSKDLDSDGDGIVNADDPEPIPVPAPQAVALNATKLPSNVEPLEPAAFAAGTSAALTSRELRLSIAPVKAASARTAVLSWTAPANAMNYLECKSSFSGADWTVVTNFVSGSVTTRVTVEEPLLKDGLRIYRVRIVPQAPK